MAIRLSCPSCNTSFALPELPADRRAACPLCGDVFPIRSFIREDHTAAQAGPSHPRPARGAAGRWSIQRAVAVALAMGLAGLLAGLGVYYFQGGLRPKPPPESEPPPLLTATPPTQLIGLGYLPADATIVFALQPGPVLAHAERMKQDPRELLISAGLPRQAYDAVTHLGLSPRQIDHIAGGTSVAELRFTFVLVLRRPLDNEDEFLKRLRAKKTDGPRERYRADISGLPVDLTLARVAPTIWVFGLDARKDLSAVDRGGHGPGGKQFAPALAEGIAVRVPPDAAAWLATSAERWDDKALIQFALRQFAGKDEWLKGLAKGRAVVAGLSLDDPPRLRLFVTVADKATGEQIRAYFANRAATDEHARHGGAGELAFFDTPIDPANTLTILRQMLNDAAKP